MALTGVHSDYVGNRHGNGVCGYSPLSVRGVSMCNCAGYPATTVQGECTVCGAGYYESVEEFRADIPPVDSGRVVVKEMQEAFPVTVWVYLGTHESTKARDYVKLANVREDSITMEDRKGIPTLVCEAFGNDRIAYVPNAVWYKTELQDGMQE
ncbi:hypothetical protein SEA_PATELGO_270 [Streptomyces phage Patelgo]|nr:hypothetical protein SEA_PATELGO_270 [Streptomyces phage Patelgo]